MYQKAGIIARSIAALAIAGLALTVSVAYAQVAYPSRPITLVVAFPPGGGVDNVARRIGELLGKSLKQTVIIENKPGAGGNLAGGIVSNARPDGYTLLYTAYAGLIIAKALGTPLKFDPMTDLTPVVFAASSSVALVVRPDLPVKNYQEFIAYAKKNPGKLNFGSNGVGSSYHLALEKIKAEENVDIVHVPFQGGMPSQLAVMGGQIDAIFASITQANPSIKSGKLKAIALASSPRSPLLPDVPTIAESGLPKYNQASNTGIFVPAGTPQAIIDRINQEVGKAMTDPGLKEALAAEAVSFPGKNSPAEFGKLLTEEFTDLAALIKQRNLTFN